MPKSSSSRNILLKLFDDQPDFVRSHARQVAVLSLRLFDLIHPYHQLSAKQRKILELAALLHDIGGVRGIHDHHKHSRDIILENDSSQTGVLVALVARYHRGALPCKKHKFYVDLSSRERQQICWLAGMLRVADGLDRTHRCRVRSLALMASSKRVTISVAFNICSTQEMIYARRKSRLLCRVFSKKKTFFSIRKSATLSSVVKPALRRSAAQS